MERKEVLLEMIGQIVNEMRTLMKVYWNGIVNGFEWDHVYICIF